MEEKTIIILKVICLAVLIVMAIAIYIHGKDLSCDKCTIKFISSNNNSVEVKAIKIADSLNQDKCYVRWDKNGYYTQD